MDDRNDGGEHDDATGDEKKPDASSVHVADFNGEWFRIEVFRKVKDAELVDAFCEARSYA